MIWSGSSLAPPSPRGVCMGGSRCSRVMLAVDQERLQRGQGITAPDLDQVGPSTRGQSRSRVPGPDLTPLTAKVARAQASSPTAARAPRCLHTMTGKGGTLPNRR